MRLDQVFIQNLKGNMLFCDVSRLVVYSDDWIFSVDCDGEKVGKVLFLQNESSGRRLEVVGGMSEGVAQDFCVFHLYSNLSKVDYNVG